MNTFLLIFAVVSTVWTLVFFGRESAKRKALACEVSYLRDSLAAQVSHLNSLGNELALLKTHGVTPEAFDTLHRAHLDLVERYAEVARKTATLPG
jgi:hypothetical protein